MLENPRSRPRVLLVEDDDVDAMLIERQFAKRKFAADLLRAHDGREALAMLRDEDRDPDVIVLDLNMPIMGGLEFLGQLRADEGLAGNVVIVLTTSSHDRDVSQARELGVAGYFVKGITDGRMDDFFTTLAANLQDRATPRN